MRLNRGSWCIMALRLPLFAVCQADATQQGMQAEALVLKNQPDPRRSPHACCTQGPAPGAGHPARPHTPAPPCAHRGGPRTCCHRSQRGVVSHWRRLCGWRHPLRPGVHHPPGGLGATGGRMSGRAPQPCLQCSLRQQFLELQAPTAQEIAPL